VSKLTSPLLILQTIKGFIKRRGRKREQ
jgi:hypothetical protein